MTDIGKEHQTGMSEFQNLLIQSFQLLILFTQFYIQSLQFVIGFSQFFVQFYLYQITSEDQSRRCKANKQEQTHTNKHDFLSIIIRQISIYLLMQSLQIARLALGIPSLHQGKICICLGNDRCTQIIITFIRLMLQYLHGKRYNLITLGRIKIRGFENTIAHKFQTTAFGCHAVYSGILIITLYTHLSGSNISTPGKTVVVSKDIIKVLCLFQDTFHCLDSTLFLPVSSLRGYNL